VNRSDQLEQYFAQGNIAAIVTLASDPSIPYNDLRSASEMLSDVGKIEDVEKILSIQRPYFEERGDTEGYNLLWARHLWRSRQLKSSLELYSELLETIEDPEIRAGVQLRIGVIYDNMGDYELAEQAVRASMKQYDLLERPHPMWGKLYGHYMLGYIYQVRGDLKSAMEYNETVISHACDEDLCFGPDDELTHIDDKLTNPSHRTMRASVLRNQSKSLHLSGKYSESFSALQESIMIFTQSKSLNAQWELAHCYQRAVEYLVDYGDRIGADKFLQQLKELAEENKKGRRSGIYLFAKGYYYIHAERMRDKTLGELALREFLEDPLFRREMAIVALELLIEHYIHEYHAYKFPEVLAEITQYMAQLKELAENQSILTIRLNSMLLEAKTLLLEGRFEQCNDIINQSMDFASEHDLDPTPVSELDAFVKSEFRSLEDIYKSNERIPDRSTHRLPGSRQKEYD
jgi:tetratricopeptide (TPR) repeat protein